MRILVTGSENGFGRALVAALAAAGHHVRAFGVAPGTDPFHGVGNVESYPGTVDLGGSIEPVACECQAIVHAANLDEPGKNDRAHAIAIERGTLYTRYAAERELVNQFVYVTPWSPGRKWSEALKLAEAHVELARVPHTTVRADPANPAGAVAQIVQLLGKAKAAPAAAATAAH